MICAKKMGAFALMFLFTAASATVYAQVPQSQPAQSPSMNQPATPQPQSQPAQPAPQQSPMDQQQPAPTQQTPSLDLNQQTSSSEVSDDELKQFASVYPDVQKKSQEAQQQMAAVIEKDGMKLDRFNAIQTAKLQNQKPDASKDELKTFDKITDELDGMQPTLQKNIESAITSSGLSVERFQAIAAAIQSDPQLRTKFQQMISGKI